MKSRSNRNSPRCRTSTRTNATKTRPRSSVSSEPSNTRPRNKPSTRYPTNARRSTLLSVDASRFGISFPQSSLSPVARSSNSTSQRWGSVKRTSQNSQPYSTPNRSNGLPCCVPTTSSEQVEGSTSLHAISSPNEANGSQVVGRTRSSPSRSSRTAGRFPSNHQPI